MSDDLTLMNEAGGSDVEEIAVIGVACRVPGAKNHAEFWENLCNGVCSIRTFSREECLASGVPEDLIDNPDYVRRLGKLDDPDLFAADFFGYLPREAEAIDPQQRIFMECAWEAMEDSGYIPDRYKGSVGVFAGSGFNYYLLKNVISGSDSIEDAIDVFTFIGNEKDFLSTRVSYKFNLTGPSFDVQTACSTSLVAVHLGCQSLLSFECDLALCGGVSLQTPRMYGYKYLDGHIFSPDGTLRPFDEKANGTLFGEGAGVVILKRLSEALRDRDNVYAVIKSTAINNDGSEKVGYTAPGIKGQAEVIRLAQNLAGVNPEDIGYIEAHGTGTQMGDPIEVSALGKVFDETAHGKHYCALGSVKANIGHLDVAAGVTGLIKTVLALKYKKIPPQINFQTPNPELHLDDSPFYISTRRIEWPASAGRPRRAGISSFGMGGTNAHAVLEEAPERRASVTERDTFIFTFSAAKKESLLQMIKNFKAYIEQNNSINPADAAYTLNTGRKIFPLRYSVTGSGFTDILENINFEKIETNITDLQNRPVKKIVFLFPGQGSEYLRMGYDLYTKDPLFRTNLDTCAGLIKKHSEYDILEILFNANPRSEQMMGQTQYSQVVLFAIEHSLAGYMMQLGLKPDAVIGHSLGEITAACISGIFSLEDAVKLVIARGKALQSAPEGAMLAAVITEDEAKMYVSEKVFISGINSERQVVFSGDKDAVLELHNSLKQAGIVSNLLKTKKPFHTPYLKSVVSGFKDVLDTLTYHAPAISIVSNVTGDWGTDRLMANPDYWIEHVLNPVRFKAGSEKLLELHNTLFIELGPGNILSSLIRTGRMFSGLNRILTTLPPQSQDVPCLKIIYNTLAKIFEYGIDISWDEFYRDEKLYRVSLPPYAFKRNRYWIDRAGCDSGNNKKIQVDITEKREVADAVKNETAANVESTGRKDELSLMIKKMLSRISGLELNDIDYQTSFIQYGLDSLFLAQFALTLEEKFKIKIKFRQLHTDYPTIQKLAEFIDNKLPDDNRKQAITKADAQTNNPGIVHFSNLAPIKPEGKRIPFFLVHGDQADYYLPQYLDKDQPYYGFFHQGADGEPFKYWSVEDIAKHYLEELLTVRPEGPYLLGGFSFGGLVAYEMAAQLIAMGKKVDLLVLIDTAYPGKSVKKRLSGYVILRKVFYGLPNRIRRKIKSIICSFYLSQSKPVPVRLRSHYIVRNYEKIYNYVPSPLDCDFVIVKATGDEYIGSDLLWKKLAGKQCYIYEAPGDHLSIISDLENFKVIIDKLNYHLELYQNK